MNEDFFKELLRRYQEGECTEEEIQIINAWFESLGDTTISTREDEEERVKKASWEQLLARRPDLQSLWEAQQEERIHSPRMQKWYWVAASLVVISLGMLFYKKEVPQQIVTEELAEVIRIEGARENDTRLIILADGSKVTLYPGSEIRYTSDFNIFTREIHLKGEAYFEVASDKNKPFLVYANGVVTKVLGTSFLVKAKENETDVEVLVTEGRVTVYKQEAAFSSQPENEIILLPQQQVKYSAIENALLPSEFEDVAQVIPVEKPGQLVFENAPLPAILESIQHAFQVQFQFDAEKIGQCRLTTSLDDESLNEILEIIGRLLDTKFERKGDVIYLAAQGC